MALWLTSRFCYCWLSWLFYFSNSSTSIQNRGRTHTHTHTHTDVMSRNQNYLAGCFWNNEINYRMEFTLSCSWKLHMAILMSLRDARQDKPHRSKVRSGHSHFLRQTCPTNLDSHALSYSVVSDSLRPHGEKSPVGYSPWDSPGKNWSGLPFPSPGRWS